MTDSPEPTFDTGAALKRAEAARINSIRWLFGRGFPFWRDTVDEDVIEQGTEQDERPAEPVLEPIETEDDE